METRSLLDWIPAAFQNAMQAAFGWPLGSKTVPESQRWFATPDRLPTVCSPHRRVEGGRG